MFQPRSRPYCEKPPWAPDWVPAQLLTEAEWKVLGCRLGLGGVPRALRCQETATVLGLALPTVWTYCTKATNKIEAYRKGYAQGLADALTNTTRLETVQDD